MSACVLNRACLHLGQTLSDLAEAREEGGEGVPNLEKSRADEKHLRLPLGDAPQLSRLSLGRVSIARKQRLHLVDRVCLEERID